MSVVTKVSYFSLSPSPFIVCHVVLCCVMCVSACSLCLVCVRFLALARSFKVGEIFTHYARRRRTIRDSQFAHHVEQSINQSFNNLDLDSHILENSPQFTTMLTRFAEPFRLSRYD